MTTLGEHIRTQKGYAFKSGWYCDDGRPIVKVSDFTDDSIESSGLVRIPEEIADDYLKYELRPGDVVIQTVGSWPNNPKSVVGRAVRVPGGVAGALLNQNAVKIEPTEELDPGFLYYLLRSELFKSYIVGTAQGAASQAAVTLDSIRAFSFDLPRLGTQKRAAETLSAYDDLIENNARRIKILEEMAQSLYREWFVHFRFPGHEKAKFVDSSLGKIPKRWDIKKLGEIADVNASSIKRGNGPKEIDYVDISSVVVGRIENIERYAFADAPGRARRIVKHGDIIWSCVRPNRKSYALILKPEPNLIVSTGFAVVSAKHAPFTYLYQALTTEEFVRYLTNRATGAAYPAVTSQDFEDARLLLPSGELLDRFDLAVSSHFELINDLHRKNANLRRTRDLLLPKLISGDVEVEALKFSER